ncbi:TPR-like protein [Candidatus Magnetobacterium bavaricum]|uniref:TPR-like protein n=1 Tax=Candidatus Magnetobacterium bavaricum TaxID=29290 RepID=A0A0F3GVW0_9BACT|nr:TPR-like protein [Candidatus Magnetobacterium bavaricum]
MSAASDLKSLADEQRLKGNYKVAIKNYRQAISLSTKRGKQGGHAHGERGRLRQIVDAQVGLALAQRALGQWKEALTALQNARQHYTDTNDKAGIAFSLWAEAGTLRVKGDIPGCVGLFKQAMGLFTLLGDESGVGYCLCGLGGAHRIKGAYQDSFDYYGRANAVFSSLDDHFGIAYSFCGMGNAFRMKNEHKEAKDYLHRALTLYGKIGDIVSSAYTLLSLGLLCTMTEKYEMADSFFDKAQQRFKATSDTRGSIYILLGKCQLGHLTNAGSDNAGLLERALQYANQYDFSVERCHCVKLDALLRGVSTDCYQQLGIASVGEALPLNIP